MQVFFFVRKLTGVVLNFEIKRIELHCSYGETNIFAIVYVIFLGLSYVGVIRIFLKTKPNFFLRRKIVMKK